jgi:hypothetical protein
MAEPVTSDKSDPYLQKLIDLTQGDGPNKPTWYEAWHVTPRADHTRSVAAWVQNQIDHTGYEPSVALTTNIKAKHLKLTLVPKEGLPSVVLEMEKYGSVAGQTETSLAELTLGQFRESTRNLVYDLYQAVVEATFGKEINRKAKIAMSEALRRAHADQELTQTKQLARQELFESIFELDL